MATKTKTFRKLDKGMLAQRDALQTQFQDATSTLETAVDEYNIALDEKWAAIESAQAALNEVIADANAWQQDVASEIQSYMDERTESWLESERGQQYDEWRQEFEQEIEAVNIDKPDTISLDLEDYSETLGERREELTGE